ncbi:MAG: FAD-dependent oxidoreductase [Alphaproteobacteria bacterium]|nr:FAD-dependent oxidoreductase [Alphaproteobacteria bacterium]
MTHAVAGVDVLVAGGGAAGVAAAIGAAQAGARVALLERQGSCGGMATSALVGTVCGLYTRAPAGRARWVHDGLPRAFGERLAADSGTSVEVTRDGLHYLPYAPLAFRVLCDRLLDAHGVSVWLHTQLIGVERTAGEVTAVRAWSWDRELRAEVAALVDTTGTASASTLAGATVADDGTHQAPALVAALADVAPCETFALKLALTREVLRGVADGALPPDAEALSIVPGSHQGGRVLLKLGLRGGMDGHAEELSRLERRGRAELTTIVAWLRARLPELAAVAIVDVAAQVGVRTGRRPVGRAVLGDDDVRGCRRHDDAVARGGWPVERWGIDARPDLELLPEGATYDIPAGACRSVDVDNLWFAGRNLSASATAIASARVIGTCLATGYAAGTLAAHHAAGHAPADAIAAARAGLGMG